MKNGRASKESKTRTCHLSDTCANDLGGFSDLAWSANSTGFDTKHRKMGAIGCTVCPAGAFSAIPDRMKTRLREKAGRRVETKTFLESC